MEILENTSTPQPQKQTVVTKGKASYVLCPLNLNKLSYGALFNSNHCKTCKYFFGVTVYPNNTVLPRLQCGASGNIRLLEFYTICHTKHNRCVKTSTCKRCRHLTSFDSATGYLNCDLIKRKYEKLVELFPKKELSVKFPFSIPCAKTGNTCTIDQCITKQSGETILACQFFKGLYNNRGTTTKLCCTHPKAVKSEYILRKFTKPKKPKQKTLNTYCLSFLFEEQVKTRPVKISCTAIKVGCLVDSPSLSTCQSCLEYGGLDAFAVKCKMFYYPNVHALIFVECPQCKGASVLLKNCIRCKKFKCIKEECVLCSWNKLDGYLQNAPKVKVNHKLSPLSHKPKFYYDVPDEV
jgi:hypothetical protein